MKNINLGQTIQTIAYVGVIAAILAPTPAIAQAWATESSCPDNTPAVFHRCALEAARTFDPPRTPDGRPDPPSVWVQQAILNGEPLLQEEQGG